MSSKTTFVLKKGKVGNQCYAVLTDGSRCPNEAIDESSLWCSTHADPCRKKLSKYKRTCGNIQQRNCNFDIDQIPDQDLKDWIDYFEDIENQSNECLQERNNFENHCIYSLDEGHIHHNQTLMQKSNQCAQLRAQLIQRWLNLSSDEEDVSPVTDEPLSPVTDSSETLSPVTESSDPFTPVTDDLPYPVKKKQVKREYNEEEELIKEMERVLIEKSKFDVIYDIEKIFQEQMNRLEKLYLDEFEPKMIYLSKHIVEIEIKKSKMINIVTGNKNSFTKAKLYAGYPKEEIMKNIKLCYTDIVTHILDDLIRTNKKDTQLMEGIWMDVKSFKLFQALDAYDVLIQFSKYNNLSLLKKYEKKLPIIFDFFQSNIWKQYQDQLLLFCILIVCFGTYCSTFFPEFLSQYNLLTSFPFEKENVVSSSPNINNLFDIFFTTKYIQYEVVTSGKTFALQLETTDNKIFERNLIEATPDFTIGDLQGYFDIIVSFFQHFVDHFDKYIDIRNFMTKDLRRSTIKEIIEGFALSFYVLLNKRNQQLLRLNESNDPIQNIFSEIYQDETRLVKLYVMVLVQLNKEHPFYIKDIKEYFQFFTVVYPGQFHKNIFFPKLGQ